MAVLSILIAGWIGWMELEEYYLGNLKEWRPDEYSERMKILEEEADKVSPSDWDNNIRIHRELLKLNPEDIKYARKLSYFEKTKGDLEKKAEEEERIRIQIEKAELSCHSAMEAFGYSKQFITKELRNPSSAEFGSRQNSLIRKIGNCKYQIINFVNAENGFGGISRQHYIIHMKFNKEEMNWYKTLGPFFGTKQEALELAQKLQ